MNEIFLNGYEILRDSLSSGKEKLVYLSLQLLYNCLNFDFTGMRREEDDDPKTLVIPTPWRTQFEQSPTICELFYRVYTSSKLPLSRLALSGLSLAFSVSKTCFSGEASKTKFLFDSMEIIQEIITKNIGI